MNPSFDERGNFPNSTQLPRACAHMLKLERLRRIDPAMYEYVDDVFRTEFTRAA
jgi:hypothetical protein